MASWGLQEAVGQQHTTCIRMIKYPCCICRSCQLKVSNHVTGITVCQIAGSDWRDMRCIDWCSYLDAWSEVVLHDLGLQVCTVPAVG